MNDDEATPKKKSDKTAENITVSLDKGEVKKDKSDSEDPKPRIVLTFRSEKSNTRSANMKIVSTEEKHEEISPRRSSRTRGKWDWVCDSDTSVSPKKDKSQPVSENDESDSSHTALKRTRRRSKDYNIIANAIALKEKSYDEATPGPTQRLSRRIKPTAKILANEELRIGLEYQNNARLGIQTDRSPEEGVRTRRSARPAAVDAEKQKVVKPSAVEPEVVELDSDSQNSDMKVQHLCKLGLKAIDPEEVEAEPEEETESQELEDEDSAEYMEEDDEEEIDDDSEVISKLLEADEDTGDEDDDEFLCAVATAKGDRPRRSSRLCSSFGMNDSDQSSTVPVDETWAPRRRSSRRTGLDDSDRSHRSKRKRRHSEEDAALEAECEDNSNPAGGDEGSEAACPSEKSAIIAKCFCDTPSKIHADPSDLTEPVFCQAIEIVDGVRVGCSHSARKSADGYGALVRAGPRAPFALVCTLHAQQLAKHMCCPACGLFCSQGVFYQCSEDHLFHLECGLPYSDSKAKPGCPHCGVYSYRWLPVNTDCCKVRVLMKSSNKTIFLPDQREQCTPAYLGFSTLSPSQLDSSPVIPEDLLPPAKDLKRLCAKPETVKCTPQELCDAILAGETLEQLIPKIVSGSKINKRLASQDGGTCVHAAARSGHLGALYLLHHAGASLSAADTNSRTPAMLAVLALLDKSELKPKNKSKQKKTPDDVEVDAKEEVKSQDSQEETESKADASADENKPKDEDLLKVIRYLVAAGADVNLPDQDMMTPLHVAAQHGSTDVCSVLLDAADVNVDARDQGGWSPLVWAAENSHHAVVRMLLGAGASATSSDNEGNSCVHWCALAGAAACLQLLLQRAPAAASAPNKHTDTPLHIAARQGHYACVVILLARGARSDIENSAGELPVDVCTGQCQNAIALNMQMNMALKDKVKPYKLLSNDISNGRELHPIPCINEVDEEPAPCDFTYVTRHVTPHPVTVDCTIQSLQGCSCSDSSCGSGEDGCACASLGVRGWWRGARLAPTFPYHDPPMLFQCNQTCRCNMKQCGNSAVSRLLCGEGATLVRAQVFRVGGARGWGLRAAARVPRGSAVAAYCGELLPLAQADTRADDTYMFALDVKPDLLEHCNDKSQLCVDACHYGSAARFINHSCRPNLAPVRVFTHTRDLRLPTVTLFATADVPPGEQFTFDYGDKFWSVKSKWMKCECGSADCRYPTRSTDETEP